VRIKASDSQEFVDRHAKRISFGCQHRRVTLNTLWIFNAFVDRRLMWARIFTSDRTSKHIYLNEGMCTHTCNIRTRMHGCFFIITSDVAYSRITPSNLSVLTWKYAYSLMLQQGAQNAVLYVVDTRLKSHRQKTNRIMNVFARPLTHGKQDRYIWVRVLTKPPWLLKQQYVPTSTFPAIVCLKTSTPNTSATISSVSLSRSAPSVESQESFFENMILN
jgi:hypothetical protein